MTRREREAEAQNSLPAAVVKAYRDTEQRIRYQVRCPVCPSWQIKGLFRDVAAAWTTHEDSGRHREALAHNRPTEVPA